jgi:hypothetical protein
MPSGGPLEATDRPTLRVMGLPPQPPMPAITVPRTLQAIEDTKSELLPPTYAALKAIVEALLSVAYEVRKPKKPSTRWRATSTRWRTRCSRWRTTEGPKLGARGSALDPRSWKPWPTAPHSLTSWLRGNCRTSRVAVGCLS